MDDWTVWGLVALVFVVGYACNRRTDRVRDELRTVHEDVDEICQWLIEIDPRFDHEKRLREDAFGGNSWAAADELKYTAERGEAGERTINDPLRRAWRAKQKQEG